MKYVVKAPGRTGGHLIVDFLKRAPGIEFDYIENNAEFEIDEWVDAKDNSIVFDHTTTCPSDPSEYTLIISKRRNKQAMLLSKMVAGITGKFYGEGTIEQKVKAQFDPMYRILAMQIKNWEEQITQLKQNPEEQKTIIVEMFYKIVSAFEPFNEYLWAKLMVLFYYLSIEKVAPVLQTAPFSKKVKESLNNLIKEAESKYSNYLNKFNKY